MTTSAGSKDMKLKWTYTRVFRLVWILNSGIITLSVLPNESKIFHCRIGAMVEERLAPPTDSHFESILWSRKYKTVYPAKHVNVDISYIYKFK